MQCLGPGLRKPKEEPGPRQVGLYNRLVYMEVLPGITSGVFHKSAYIFF